MINFRTFTRGFIIGTIGFLSVGAMRAIKIGHLDYNILSEENRTVDVAWGEGRDTTIKLDSLFIPSKVTINDKDYSVCEIRDGGFGHVTQIREFIDIPSSVRTVRQMAMSSLRVNTVNFNEGLDSIEIMAFQYSEIKECHLPPNLKYIGMWAFRENYNLDNLVIPTGVFIDLCGFECYGGKKLTFEPGETRLNGFNFVLAENLEYLEIPSGLTLAHCVFAGEINLKKLIIHEDVIFKSDQNFGIAEGYYQNEHFVIDTICYLEKEPKEIRDQFTEETYRRGILCVLPEALEKAKRTYPWSEFRRIKAIDTSAGIHIEEETKMNCNETEEFFNLQGVPVNGINGTLPPGIYIRCKHGKSEKIMIK